MVAVWGNLAAYSYLLTPPWYGIVLIAAVMIPTLLWNLSKYGEGEFVRVPLDDLQTSPVWLTDFCESRAPLLSKSSAWSVSAVAYTSCVIPVLATMLYFQLCPHPMSSDPLSFAAIADVVCTIWIFGFSYAFNNSSVYDPYWSVAPPVMALFWALHPLSAGVVNARKWLVLALVLLWAVRLTYNCMRKWREMKHEDWRYVQLAQEHGLLYWPISFAGIHLMPTVLVLFGCIPIYFTLVHGHRPLNLLDLLAASVTLAGIALETAADEQMRAFSEQAASKAGGVLSSGVWAWSRHPNYVGESLFWWGMFTFSLASVGTTYIQYTLWGALLITALLAFISIPLMEKRQAQRRGAAWADYARRVPAFVGIPSA